MEKDKKKIIAGAAILGTFAAVIAWMRARPPVGTGSLYGIIIDASTEIPIVGKYVIIDGYRSTARSDSSGYFICNLPEGYYYTLSVEGYQSVSI